MSLGIQRVARSCFALATLVACCLAVVDRVQANIPVSRAESLDIGDWRDRDTVGGVSQVASISRQLLDNSLATEQDALTLPAFARTLSWEEATVAELSNSVDFVPDTPDKLLASVDDGRDVKVGRLEVMRPYVSGEPALGSLTGTDTSSGVRPIDGNSLPGIGQGSVTRFTGATSNRLETAPVPGAVLLAALGIGLVGIARMRGWVC